MSDSDKDLFYADDKVKEQAHGTSLISFEKGKLTVAPEGAKILSKLKKKTGTNLVFIFGNARSGKSFMMNCLSGVRGLFKVVNSAVPVTKGVDISSHIAPFDELAKAVGLDEQSSSSSSGKSGLFRKAKDSIGGKKRSPNIGFVDVEGQGAEDGMYDTMLALPLLMTSKVVLFNHKGAPTVSDMLSKLGVLARAAEYIDLSDDGKVPERPDSPGVDSDTEETREKSGTKKFGHLHVLFRDFSFDGDRDSVYHQLMGKEKVVHTVKSPKGVDNAAKAAKERNDIRDLLLQNFESINVWLFKQPATADDLKAHAELPHSAIDKEFIATVRELRQTCVEQMREPLSFNGKVLSGPRVVSLLTQICTVLNEGGTINVPSVFRAMEKEAVDRVGNDCFQKFAKQVAALEEKLPMPNTELAAKTKELLEAMFKKFDTELEECKLEAEIKAKRTELTANSNRSIADIERSNANATLTRVKKVITAEMGKMRTDFESFCEKNMPLEDGKKIEIAFRDLKEKTRASIKDQLKDLPQALQLQEFQMMLLEQEEVLQEFLTLQTIKNESMMKDHTIEKMHAEAIARQELLIEQNKKLEKYVAEEKSNTELMKKQLEDLRTQKEAEDKRAKETEMRLKAQTEELERLRKQRKKCAIL